MKGLGGRGGHGNPKNIRCDPVPDHQAVISKRHLVFPDDEEVLVQGHMCMMESQQGCQLWAAQRSQSLGTGMPPPKPS